MRQPIAVASNVINRGIIIVDVAADIDISFIVF